MIAAHSLLQINRVTEQFPLALLLSHHGTTALSDCHSFGYDYFSRESIWATRPLDLTLLTLDLLVLHRTLVQLKGCAAHNLSIDYDINAICARLEFT